MAVIPLSTTPKRQVWVKALLKRQATLGASAKASNNPRAGDPTRRIKEKILNTFNQ